MDFKVQFDTIEELQQIYPIGFVVFSRQTLKLRNQAYANQTDLEILRRQYGSENVTVLDECYARYQYIEVFEKKVEGYLYDGEHWYPAYSTWDGWTPYDEDDFKR